MKKRVLIFVIALMAIFTLTSCSKKFTVTFDSNGGSAVSSVEVKKNKTVAMPTDPTKEDNKFLGWTLDGVDYVFSTKVTKDITLKAKWEVTAVTITFNSVGGSTFEATKISKGGTLDLSKYVPTKEGYEFQGWKKGTNLVKENTTFEENTTLTAAWKEVTYTVKYDLDGGIVAAGSVLEVTVKAGTPLTADQKLADPTKEGNKFMGWMLDDVEFDFNSNITKDMTLKAKWEKLQGYEFVTITFNTNGGSTISPIEIVKGGTISVNEPKKAGYTFKGWMLNGTLVTDTTTFDEDTTLLAEWEEAYVTITFNTNGGSEISATQTRYDSTFIISDYLSSYENVKDGYEFQGWYLDENFQTSAPDELVVENEDITLYAKWKKSGTYKPKWQPGQQVGGWKGKGMSVKIMVLPTSSFDPYDKDYNQSDQKVRQQHEALVESEYDIFIDYVAWGNNAAWGPDRIQYIKDNSNGGFRNNDVYIINITASWIPTLVRDNCLAPLYNIKEDSGIFTEVGYKETYEGSEKYVPAPYEQIETNNQAASNANVVYGYVTGKARPDYFMYYNVDLISQSGLEDPAEMWFKGEWTWSNFETYAKSLQTYLSTLSTAESEYKALAMGYPEFFIGSCGSTGSQITSVSPARLYLNSQNVVDQLGAMQKLVNSGVYDKTRGVADVATSFTQGLSAFVHGDLWFLKDPSRFDPTWKFEIGCVPYPTADGQGGKPILTDDPEEAIYTRNEEPLIDANGQYIKGVDMSDSSFKVPFTTTSCYSVVNTPSGKNGITNKIIFAIMYDLFDGQGADPDAPVQTEDEAYRNFLAQKKFDSEIYADVIMSVQDCTYFEVIEIVSMSVGGGSQFGPNTLWKTIPNICTEDTKSPSAEMSSIYEIYRKQMRDMGYMVP